MVSIITVNYNGWKDTCELIDSLKRFETYPYEVIVVDNASLGPDVSQIRAAHPDVQIVCSHQNLGFAGGNNLGYQRAQGDFLLFLNNDIVLKSPMLAPMVQRLADVSIGGVSPCIHYYHSPMVIQYYGYQDMTSITLKHTTRPFVGAQRSEFMQPQDTEVLHGAAMMVRRDVIEKVGVMTEIYFLFYEEFDWSRRMREAGYRLFYEPASEVYHKESMSIPKATPFREYYLSRARMIYARRNCKGVEWLVACLYQLFLAAPKKIFSFLLKGRMDLAQSVCQGVCSGLFKEITQRR